MAAIHQGAVPPDRMPYVLDELDFPGTNEITQVFNLQKKAIDRRVDALLNAEDGAENIQPQPGEDLNLTLQRYNIAMWSGRVPRSSEEGQKLFMASLSEVMQAIEQQQEAAMWQQIAIESMKNFHVPTPGTYLDPETGDVKQTKEGTSTPSPNRS